MLRFGYDDLYEIARLYANVFKWYWDTQKNCFIDMKRYRENGKEKYNYHVLCLNQPKKGFYKYIASSIIEAKKYVEDNF